eukprot:Platyproteum_vivax@DN2268_c0_g1_i1.p1
MKRNSHAPLPPQISNRRSSPIRDQNEDNNYWGDSTRSAVVHEKHYDDVIGSEPVWKPFAKPQRPEQTSPQGNTEYGREAMEGRPRNVSWPRRDDNRGRYPDRDRERDFIDDRRSGPRDDRRRDFDRRPRDRPEPRFVSRRDSRDWRGDRGDRADFPPEREWRDRRPMSSGDVYPSDRPHLDGDYGPPPSDQDAFKFGAEEMPHEKVDAERDRETVPPYPVNPLAGLENGVPPEGPLHFPPNNEIPRVYCVLDLLDPNLFSDTELAARLQDTYIQHRLGSSKFQLSKPPPSNFCFGSPMCRKMRNAIYQFAQEAADDPVQMWHLMYKRKHEWLDEARGLLKETQKINSDPKICLYMHDDNDELLGSQPLMELMNAVVEEHNAKRVGLA